MTPQAVAALQRQVINCAQSLAGIWRAEGAPNSVSSGDEGGRIELSEAGVEQLRDGAKRNAERAIRLSAEFEQTRDLRLIKKAAEHIMASRACRVTLCTKKNQNLDESQMEFRGVGISWPGPLDQDRGSNPTSQGRPCQLPSNTLLGGINQSVHLRFDTSKQHRIANLPQQRSKRD